jgi:hypothetical protein
MFLPLKSGTWTRPCRGHGLFSILHSVHRARARARARASGWAPAIGKAETAERVCGGGVAGTRLSLNDLGADHRAKKRRRRDRRSARNCSTARAPVGGAPRLRQSLPPRELQPAGRRRTLDACEAAGPVQATHLAWPRLFVGRSKLLGDRRLGDATCTKHYHRKAHSPPPSWLATTAWAWRRAQQVVTHAFYQLREARPIVARPSVAPSWPP